MASLEQKVAMVDLYVIHELDDEGRCACGDFLGTKDDHRRHLGAAIVAGAGRAMAQARALAKPR